MQKYLKLGSNGFTIFSNTWKKQRNVEISRHMESLHVRYRRQDPHLMVVTTAFTHFLKSALITSTY